MVAYDSNGNEVNISETIKETDKKCPMCGGLMSFDPGKGGLYCPYCEYVEKIDREARAEEQDFYAAEERGNCNWGVETKVVICKSCGAETIYDVMQTSGECPYCGSNQVMEAKGKNTLAPNGVCPFAITKEKANLNFTNWIKHKIFCPTAAKKSAQSKGFTGMYLPYWTFDAQSVSNYTASYGIDHTIHTKDGTRTVTDWYHTFGVYEKFIDDELVPASNRHDKNLLRAIEPFNTAASVIYKPEYISGFASERYSLGLNDAWKQADASIQNTLKRDITRKILRDHFADRVSNLQFSTRYSNKKYKYLMLPVWFSNFNYKGKIYRFNVNGQTGKVGGRAPVSPLRVLIAVLLGLLALATVIFLFLLISGEFSGGQHQHDYYYYETNFGPVRGMIDFLRNII